MAEAGLRAVLFDAVGTLIELREPVGESYARVARDHGVALPAAHLDEAFRRIWRQRGPMPAGDAEVERTWWRDVVRGTFRAADGTARFPDFDAFFDSLWRRFSGADAWRARPGAAEILAALRTRGLATAVVSNFDRRLGGLLDALGLRRHLDALVLPSDAGAAKPDPLIFAFALKRLGVPAAAALYVGDDRERDVEAARRAGLRAVDAKGLANLADVIQHLDPAPESR